MATWYSTVYIPHFIYPVFHWWAFGLIPWSLPLWTVQQWTCACMCLYDRMIYIPLDMYSVMGFLGQMEFIFLDPWGISTLSSTMVELIYTPTNSVKCFYISTSSPASVASRFFNDCHSNWCEMVSQCGFDLHLSNDPWWWVFFSYICWPHVCLLL